MKHPTTLPFALGLLFLSLSLQSQNTVELYEDPNTGQLYSKPGPGRNKVTATNPALTNPATVLPDASAHRPDSLSKEKLTLFGRSQFRAVSGSEDSLFSNGHRDFNAVDWNVRRLRIGVMYENDYWGTNIQMRMENMFNRPDISQTTSTINFTDANGNPANATLVNNVRMRDNRGFLHEAFLFAKIPFANMRFSVGQIPTQFNREFLTSSANFVSLERSLIVNALPQFDHGIMVQASPLKFIQPKWDKHFQVSLMHSNGKGAGGDYGTGRRQDLTTANRFGAVNISPITYARAQYNVFGGLVRESDGKTVAWQEGEEIFQKETKLSLGMGYVQTQNLITPVLSVMEFTPGNTNVIQLLQSQGANPDRGTLDPVTGFGNYNVINSVPTPGRPKFGLVGRTYDATFISHGFYLSGAFSKFSGSASNNLNAYHGTVGYIFPIYERFHLMPILKYEYVEGDFNRNARIDPTDTLHVYWAGLNFFGDKHHFKAQLYYQILGNRFDINPNTGNAMPIDDRRVYLQIQANFWTGIVSPEAYSFRPE